MKHLSFVAAAAIALSAAAATSCAPPRGPLDCHMIVSKPGTMGMPKDKFTWSWLNPNGWNFDTWLAECGRRGFQIVKDPSAPNGTTPYDVLLETENCTGIAPLGLAADWVNARLVIGFV